MPAKRYFCAAALQFAILPVLAANQNTINLCSQLHAQLPSQVIYPPSTNSSQMAVTNSSSAAYTEAQGRYWDTANAEDIPGCVLFPSTAQDVSKAMQLLNQAPDVPFALKSGGHNWNRGFSSTNGGVLISFRPSMNYTKLSQDTKSAEVGPGSRWGEVMAVLDEHDLCVVGGRVGDVGVGGYIPLGGISFLTSQYGFAADNVLNFEVVTANGTILNANQTSNPDIFFAIRGGGNLFGVVTKYTLATHPIGNVWGGVKAYAAEQFPQVFAAITNYTANFNESKSAISPTLTWTSSDGSASNGTPPEPIFNVFFFWDDPTPPPANVFAAFDGIPTSIDQTGIARYPELLNVTIPPGLTLRTSDAVSSLPNMPQAEMSDFLNRLYEQVSNASFFTAPGFVLFSLDIQPIPTLLQQANFERGPAALSTNPAGGDKIWIEYSLGWADPKYDGSWPSELISVVHAGRNMQQLQYPGVKPTNYQSGDLDWVPYNPLFANDAQASQPVLQSYGTDTYNKLRNLHAQLDPNNIFLLQTQGFQF